MMQFNYPLLCMLLFAMRSTGQVSIPATPKNADRSFHLLSEAPLGTNKFPDFGGAVGVMPVNTPNKLIDAAILVSKADFKLELFVRNRQGRQVLKMPVKSIGVSFAPDAQMFAVAGKRTNEYKLDPDVPPVSEGVQVFNFSGKLLYELKDTGPISSMRLLNNGRLLLQSANGLMLYDKNKNVMWRNKWDPVRTSFSADNNFMFAVFLNDDGETFTASLCDLNTGDMLQSFKYSGETEIMLLYADRSKNLFAFSEYNEANGIPGWNIKVFDLKSSRLLHELKNLNAGPFSLCYNADANSFGMMLRTPDINGVEGRGKIYLAEWLLNDGSLAKHDMNSVSIDFNEDYLKYDTLSHNYILVYGNYVKNYKVQ